MNKQWADTCLRYLDGDLSEAELREFTDLIARSEDAADLLAELALDEQVYRQSPAEPEAIEEELPAIHLDAEALTKQKYAAALSYVLRHTFTPKRIAMLATAAALLLGMVITAVMLTGPDEPETIAELPDVTTPPVESPRVNPIVATLTAEHDAEWSADSAEVASAPGSPLRAGQRLTLTQGFAEITTKRGAVAILEGPCVVELMDNDNALRLHAGKLVGLCHTESSKGFVVKTDFADITDLGTEFGVTATRDGLEATVFVGEIAIKTPNAPTQLVKHRQTARVSRDQGQPVLVVEDRLATGYAQRMPRSALITDARVNLPGFDVEIVPNGVYEDTKLYTDRVHELNSIDELGLPSVLIGGDLIRTPTEAREKDTLGALESMRLDVELSAPADVYLLYGQNEEVREWLERDYERTSMVVGVDLGPFTGVERYSLATGPAQSVDRKCDVWKRKQPGEGRFTAGYGIHVQMYSIIVVPRRNTTNEGLTN
jgi:ferric-dicitrate binding protein FerR (iron transport regulator)